MTDYIHVSAGGEVSYIPGDYIVTCDEETASWIGNDADSMRLLVRCRDCKHYEKLPEYFGRCHPLGIMFADMDDGYCAWGERKKVDE